MAHGARAKAQSPESERPSEGAHEYAFGGYPLALRRLAADRSVRRLSAVDGLLGGGDAGRRVSDRGRRLGGGGEAARHRRGQGAEDQGDAPSRHQTQEGQKQSPSPTLGRRIL